MILMGSLNAYPIVLAMLMKIKMQWGTLAEEYRLKILH